MFILLYILLLILVIGLLLTGVIKVSNTIYEEPGAFLFKTLLLMLAWLAYIFTLSFSGLLTNFSLPPRLPLFLVLPFIVFLTYFFTNVRFRPLIDVIPIQAPIYFQTFRVGVELLIFYAFYKGIFPHTVTYEGYNFDILAGLTAPIVGYMLSKGMRGSRTIALIWNCLGLLLLTNVVIIFNTAAYYPQLWGASKSLIKTDYGMLPLALLAGVFMPTAVFMHVLSIVSLLRTKKKLATT